MSHVVISGLGAVSAFGVGVGTLRDGLLAGRSAVGPIRSFDASSFATQMAAEVLPAPMTADWLCSQLQGPLGDLSQMQSYLERGAWRDRKAVFALLSAQQAWQMAGCGVAEKSASVVMALGLEQAFLEDFAPIFDAHMGIDWHAGLALGRDIRLRAELDLGAQWVADGLGLLGTVVVNASACAAGGLAIAQAAMMVARGQSEVVLCGGADSMVNPLGLGGMSRLGAPSPRRSVDACRPFDLHRDGLVLGEGAAMFVLELESRALARGVQPLARILGHGNTQDAYHATAPRPDGTRAQQAMQQALRRAGLPAQAIGYVNAHGTGTPRNDAAEARAICNTFGAATEALPVSSIKGAVGHTMAASGAIEAAVCVLALQHGFLPGTAHYLTPDPQCPINVIGPRPVQTQVSSVLSNSFGFGGQNVALVLGRY
jgi:3-oxoacyl-[acyl-carrier-protein] synthase II